MFKKTKVYGGLQHGCEEEYVALLVKHVET